MCLLGEIMRYFCVFKSDKELPTVGSTRGVQLLTEHFIFYAVWYVIET